MNIQKTRQKVSYMAGAEFNTKKNISIMSMIEQMIETRTWKKGDLPKIVRADCVCKVQRETVQFLLDGYKMLASSDYLARNNRALTVMAVAWAKEQNLLDRNVKWYQEKWNRGHVLENSQANLVFDD